MSVSIAYSVSTPTAFALTTGAKTILNVIAPSGHGLAMVEFGISFDGVTSDAVPAIVELVNSTQATAGTSGVSPDIEQIRGRLTSGAAPTAGSNFTVEPTVLVVLKKFYVPQFNGLFVYQFPLGREAECESDAGTIEALGIRVSVSAGVNAVAYIEVEAIG